jgi:hypothetical protein
MKNIHIILTEKPSRLYFNINDKEFQICEIEKTSTILKPNRHIYITSDEEIKEGDWFITKGEVFKCTMSDEFIWRNNFDKFPSIKIECKKIILTTDQDLIDDEVQAIQNDFLEWFVKNPICENIKTEFFAKFSNNLYKIIIPKEESKQETLEEVAERKFQNIGDRLIFEDGAKWQQEKWQQIVPFDAYNIEVFAIKPDEQGKLFAYIGYKITNGNFHFSVVPFTEPQQERSYSEEEVNVLICMLKGTTEFEVLQSFRDRVEQFKNK